MLKALPPVLIASLAVAGCGGSASKNADGGQKRKDTVTVGHNQPIAFGAAEYSFEPKNVIVDSGTTGPSVVRFVVRNNGALAHDLHVERGGQDLGGTPIFGPGGTKSGEVTLTPGTYQFLCTVGDHADLGMKGTLTVTSKKTQRPGEKDAGKPGAKDKQGR